MKSNDTWTQQTGSRKDVALASGRVVKHSREPNGSQLARMADGGDMSEQEWEEYCGLIRSQSTAKPT